ncbi:riboflavin synthase [Pontibacter akesuensis]|uniref:Riboflavin synthase n=1 Tax=Pontibacter akesuensis TaxID=388950 RepID=A0A1I7FZQ4_9BACT|nr:riboflavin synthase [Pontibacter akesuensis]GHA59660.1 riboflavin synthase subunit alpha [Pontibacter akesuensis]SFU41688.1 riboflavin synthase alpha chain [Pontibacter akesuensis]
MFTGIIEGLGRVTAIREENTNKHFTLSSPFTNELKIDQSVAHNGVCLTVVSIKGDEYTVTAIDETLKKTNLNHLKSGDVVNLERCMLSNGRFDGHVVQGHVDQTAICEEVKDENGSWIFTFRYETSQGNVTVEKGSICVNGISLTVFNSQEDRFSVAIIPYTYEHTNLHQVKAGDTVNLEFDIIGKYVARLLGKQ